jgi:predicted Fe-Mo cluster-binding NifX family protein
VSYHVVVVFDRDEDGNLRAGEVREATSAAAAVGAAQALAEEHAGAVAFSRTGDPATGDFRDATILAQFGDVDLDALSA